MNKKYQIYAERRTGMDRVKVLIECAGCGYKFEEDITNTDSDTPTPCPNCGLVGITITHLLME